MTLIAFVLLFAAAFFYWAEGNVNHGIRLADRACNAAQSLCEQPYWLLAGAGVAILIVTFQSFMKNSN